MAKRMLTWLVLTVMGIAPVFSQQGSQANSNNGQKQEETIRISTAAVQMDVIVTDKTGRRIKGLTAPDFELLDEGKQQTIDYFTAIEGAHATQSENRSTPGELATTGGAPKKSGTLVTPLTTPYLGRHIAIVFDDLSLSSDSSLRARQALTEYINRKLTATDMAALISTGGSIASLQQFTNDKERLLSALRRISLQTTGAARTRNRFNITPAEAVRIDSGDERALDTIVRRVSTESLANQVGAGSSTLADPGLDARARMADVDALKSQVRNEAHSVLAQNALDIRNVISMFSNLFRAMSDLPGRKIAVLLTESLATLGGSSEDVSNQMIQLIELARRSGVSVYALDAAGLRTKSTTASEYITGSGLQIRTTSPSLIFSDFENLSAARALVAGTGGQLFANTNDIEAGIERAVEDSSSYYVVGFKPPLLDNKFHRLALSVKGRPELIVRTRRGYLALDHETVPGTNTELVMALMSPLPYIDLPLEVVANVVPKDNDQIIMVGLHVGRNYLTLPELTASDQTAGYEVLAWVFATGRDQPVGVIKRTVTFDLAQKPDDRAKLKTAGFVFVPQPLNLPPSLYQIRAVVREKSTGAVGSAYQFFEVPDVKNSKTVSLSSLLLSAAGQIGFSGKNSFKPGAEIDLRFMVYNLPKEVSGLSQRIKLTAANGQVLMDSELPLMPSPGQQLHSQGTRLTLPTARGRYAVLVNLKDAKSKIDVERRADLVID